ncbi:hypothetical protein ACHAXT_012751 [Thalassiosira profunda]
MEAVELAEPPSAARRRLSATLGAGVADKRRGSLLALEHPSVLEPEPALVAATEDTPHDDAEPKGKKRASIISRRASTISRVLAFSTTAKSFHEERILATKINAMIWLDEPNSDVDKLRRTLAERLLAIPRFRCVVRNGEKGSVVFESLARSEVKIGEHIVHVDGGNNFGPHEVQELINEAYLSQWHSDMPLWRMKIVTNTGDGRSLLFASVDHAIGDGAGLLSVFLSLFDDESPGGDDSKKGSKESNPMVRGEKRTPTGLSRSHRFVAVMKGIWFGVVTTLFGPPIDMHHLLKVPKSKLSEPSLGKDFAQTRAFPLEEIKAMKNKLRGATVNDVVVALLSMAIARYLKERGDDAVGRSTIRASLPVNMRESGNDGLGNDFVMAILRLPVESPDPIDCVWRAKTYVDELKLSPAFSIIQWLNHNLLHSLPPTLMAGMLLDAFTRPTCMISNVIGPQDKASIGGYPVDDLNFTVSFPNNLYFGVLSFGGTLRISGILDRKTGGDLDELMDCIEDSYDELQAALEGVDEKEPIERPDSTPLRAKILEVLFFVTVVALPVLVARKFA